MAKARAADVARIGAELTRRNPPIPYVHGGEDISGMDCQGYVEYCVRRAGGKMSYAGSNDMFRNAGSVYTLSEARQKGLLRPGVGLLIVTQDGKEPEKYKKDGLGNASHVGLFLGTDGVEVGHASSSRGCVTQSTLKNGWTHAIVFDAIEYGAEAGTGDEENSASSGTCRVQADGGLRMRKAPSLKGRYMLVIPDGTLLEVSEVSGGFGKVSYRGHTGWCAMDYLAEVKEEEPTDAPDTETETGDEVMVPRDVLIALADAGNALETWMKKQRLGVNAAVRRAAEAIADTAAYLSGDD